MSRSQQLLLVLGLIGAAAASRLVPHVNNFVPVGAMALFGAAALPKKWLAVVVPAAAFYLSDLVLNNTVYAAYYEGFHWGASWWSLGAIVLMVIFGMGLLRHRAFSWLRVGGAAIGATAIFYLVTNFGVWVGGTMYPKTITGLVACYAAGLPFVLNSLLANLAFSSLLFGLGRYLELRELTVAPARS